MLFKDLCLSHFVIFCQQTFESVDGQLPFLLPSIEIAIQRLDKLHPSLNITIFIMRETLENQKQIQSRLHHLLPLGRQTKSDPFELHLNI